MIITCISVLKNIFVDHRLECLNFKLFFQLLKPQWSLHSSSAGPHFTRRDSATSTSRRQRSSGRWTSTSTTSQAFSTTCPQPSTPSCTTWWAPGDNVINKFWNSIVDVHWNKTLWLPAASHVTTLNQSECLISRYLIYSKVGLLHWLLVCRICSKNTNRQDEPLSMHNCFTFSYLYSQWQNVLLLNLRKCVSLILTTQFLLKGNNKRHILLQLHCLDLCQLNP